MKVSLNTANKLSNVDIASNGVESLITAVGQQLGAVEDVINWGSIFDGIVVARVESCEPHPDADKLSVCLVDDDGVVKDVDRNSDGLVQVVCGANNVAKGQLIAWIPPGVVVPQTANSEPFELASKELRGVMSHGMIASKRELLIADEHDGILVIENDATDEPIDLGAPFKNLYSLDDTVIDLENKMFTHRPDCFGTLGVARELAAIQGQQFASPDWYQKEPQLPRAEDSSLDATIDTDNASRFVLVDIENITIKDSPVWLQSALMKIGIKPLNNVVDITNYVMHITGQPLHAYDYEKLANNNQVTLSVRQAKSDEEVYLLNDTTLKLTDEDVVIANGDDAVGIAGVMGGKDSEVSDGTKRIILECGTFDMYAIRRSAMRHGLFTEAVTRFNKGQSPLQNLYVVGYAIKLLSELATGVVRDYVDVSKGALELAKPVEVTATFINERLGSKFAAKEIQDVLKRAEIYSSLGDDNLSVQPPFWRMDLEIAEDIVEEVGRLVGFHTLPVGLPTRPTKPAPVNQHLKFEMDIRNTLAAAGANEVLTYNFVHGRLYDAAGQDRDNGYKLRNALSPQLQYYRQSLTPSLAEHVYSNIRAGNDEIVLFEIGSAHHRQAVDEMEPELPQEIRSLSLILSANDKLEREKQSGAAYFAARNYLSHVLASLGVEYRVEPAAEVNDPMLKPFDKQRAGQIMINDLVIGYIGEMNPLMTQKLKLPSYTAAFEIKLEALMSVVGERVEYQPLSKFPTTDRDVTLRLEDKFSYADLYSVIVEFCSSKTDIDSFSLKEAYRSEDESDTSRNITLNFIFRSMTKTLATEEVNAIVDELAEHLASKFNATIV